MTVTYLLEIMTRLCQFSVADLYLRAVPILPSRLPFSSIGPIRVMQARFAMWLVSEGISIPQYSRTQPRARHLNGTRVIGTQDVLRLRVRFVARGSSDSDRNL